ncbi:MAG: GNAT family N-acetyltransferase [Alphaproteobacteria bacterium]|nr:GNAT family N-acetyltransferase [Alphaproteobacteria bacterium]
MKVATHRIVPRFDVDVDVWNSLVDSSNDGWFFHRYEFQDALATWPAYEDRSFAIVSDRAPYEILAVQPCHSRGGAVLESLGGVACHPDLEQHQRREVIQAAYDSLLDYANRFSLERLEVRLSPMAPSLVGPSCPRVNPLIYHGLDNRPSQTYVVELDCTEEELWSRLHPNCRTHIRKAEREGCSVRLASPVAADLDRYYDLHCETYQRTGARPHPKEYFSAIWQHFVKSGLAVVFFAERNGEVIAADNEIFYKRTMSGWTAAGNSLAAKLGANNLLHWRAMQWALANGGLWYESGEAFPGAREGKSKGLNDFKRSFGGELYPIYRGSFDLPKTGTELPVAPTTTITTRIRSKMNRSIRRFVLGD